MEIALAVCAAAATASAAAGLQQWHYLFKPLTLVLAIVLVARYRPPLDALGLARPLTGKPWLLAALAGSLAGDVFLMFEGFFIPGLVAFLLAHLAYLMLLHQGVNWFPRRRALAATAGVGAAMFAYLWHGGLPAELRAPVATYVSVIALMAAQAMGRASVLGHGPARRVAVGAACFMLSDALLATNRFVQPLALAPLWVLGSYYAAQILILGGWLREQVGDAPRDP